LLPPRPTDLSGATGSTPVASAGGGELVHLEAWLSTHLDVVAALVVVVGFVIRLVTASQSYLNPDEALHYLLANQASLVDAYKASLTNAHPPLLFLMLYFWRFLGNSEIILRLLSVLAGTATIWVGYRWLDCALGKTAGLIALLLLAFTPTMISISTEVRQYAALLCFMICALCFLERAFKQCSVRAILVFSVFLYLAILTHYSALWFTLAVGVYVLVRVLGREKMGALPVFASKTSGVPNFLITWAGFQAGALALYAVLYVTHISRLRGGGMEREATGGWLQSGYFHKGQDSLLLFPVRATGAAFTYLFSSPLVGPAALILFLAGAILLLARRPRALGILLLLPFVVACGGAIAGAYPYGGTRHVVFLALFAVAGIAALLARLAGNRVGSVLLAGILVAPIWNLTATPPAQHISAANQRKDLMSAAVGYIRESVPPGSTFFVDYQTSLELGYNLGRNQIAQHTDPPEGFFEYDYGGYRIVSSPIWSFSSRDFFTELSRMKLAYGLDSEYPVWIADGGWGVCLNDELARAQPAVRYRALRAFGRNFAVFRLAPDVPQLGTEATSRALSALARAVTATQLGTLPAFASKTGGIPNLNAVFWPDAGPGELVHLDSASRLLERVGLRPQHVLTYAELYRSAQSREHRFDDYLPALAFWVFDAPERHVQLLSYMNDRENYISGDYQFTLLAIDPDSIAGVFEIRAHRPELP
jgi:hypothetical protein